MWIRREMKRRRKILDAVSEALALNEEVALQMDSLGDVRDRLIARTQELLDMYGEEWPPEKDRMDIIDIGPECFASGDSLVISYKGANYYKACGEIVNEVPRGGTTSCVRRVNHGGRIHEDYYGNILELPDPGVAEAETFLVPKSGG